MTQGVLSPIRVVKGVGPKLAVLLSKKGIQTLEDALYFLPREYEDRRRMTRISDLKNGENATVLAEVVSSRELGAGRTSRFEAVVTDGSGDLALVWFHAYPSLKSEFVVGESFFLFGKVGFFGKRPSLSHPEYEKAKFAEDGKPVASPNFGRVLPVYSETEGLHQKTIRRIMREALTLSLPELKERLPEAIRVRLGLPPLSSSFSFVHAPSEGTALTLAPCLRRILFEEFFPFQLALVMKKENRKKEIGYSMAEGKDLLEKFRVGLPFALTRDQTLALTGIRADLAKNQSMCRLLQGDVGSGKTVVALGATVIAAANGFQSAFMVPTEILALQHYKVAENLLSPLGIEVALLTSATQPEKNDLSSGKVKVVIGTHALFQKGVDFHRLNLVIVDEQHRFGVEQRQALLKKSERVPHLLMMSATPIPRTLSLTLYGDLEMSILREKPSGRKPVRTSLLSEKSRPRLYSKIKERVQKGEQVYIVYPLVDVSEKLELKSATEMWERLKREVFPDFSVGLLHGKMPPEEKEKVLRDFQAGTTSILVATTVIEVGIDIPNATLMVIEHPERLGLSQLHQLRGRVGRGSASSECLLVIDGFAGERLRIMTRTEDGFEIAEEDLRIRGPGEFLGTRQSGLPGFRVGHILRDAALISEARQEAERILSEDPDLSEGENRGIRELVETTWKDKLARIGN